MESPASATRSKKPTASKEGAGETLETVFEEEEQQQPKRGGHRLPTTAATAAAAAKKKAPPAKKKAPAKKSKKAAPVKTEEDAKKAMAEINSKPPNFSPQENYYLCRAWGKASEDPVVGNDRKSEAFWHKVKAVFNQIYEEEADVVAQYTLDRGWESLKNRWNRHILKPMNCFAREYLHLKRQEKSGWNEDKYRMMAMELYRSSENKAFLLENCIDVLMEIPKFEPFNAKEKKRKATDNGDADRAKLARNLNNIGEAMGGNLERPVGTKSALKAMRDASTLASVAAGDKKYQDTVAGSMVTYAHEAKRKGKTHRLQLDFAMYKDMADNEGMRKAHAKLQAFQKKCEQEDEEQEQEELKKRLFDDASVPANVSVAVAPEKEKTVEQLVDEFDALERAEADDELLNSGLQPGAGKKTTGEDEDDDDDDASEESSKRSIPSRSEVFDQYTNGPDPPADDEDDDGDSTDEDEEQELQKQVQRHEDV